MKKKLGCKNKEKHNEFSNKGKTSPLFRHTIICMIAKILICASLLFYIISCQAPRMGIAGSGLVTEPWYLTVESTIDTKRVLADLTSELELRIGKQFKNRKDYLSSDYETYTVTLVINDPIVPGSAIEGIHRLSATINLRVDEILIKADQKDITVQPIVFIDISRTEQGKAWLWFDRDHGYKAGEFKETIIGVIRSIHTHKILIN